jgi:hypothetical protein
MTDTSWRATQVSIYVAMGIQSELECVTTALFFSHYVILDAYPVFLYTIEVPIAFFSHT